MATLVTLMWRASAVERWSLNIHPRNPVGPKFQSWVASAGIGSPLRKSGLGIGPFFPAASQGTVRAAAHVTAIRTGNFFFVPSIVVVRCLGIKGCRGFETVAGEHGRKQAEPLAWSRRGMSK